MTTTKERPVTIEYTPEYADQLNAIKTWVGRARLASEIAFEQSREVETQDVQLFLEVHGHADANRPRVSRALNALRKKYDIKTTGEIPAMTEEKMQEIERDFHRGDDSGELAGVHNIAELQASTANLNGAKVETATDIPSPRVTRESTPPVPSVPPVPSEAPPPSSEERSELTGWRKGVRAAYDWAEGRFQDVVYIALLTVAAYGLYEVLFHLTGLPQPLAIFGAIGMELVGISLKVAADRAERRNEKRPVVWALLSISGLIAVGIAAVNWWGHTEIDGPLVALVFASASIVGYSLWTIKSLIEHRAYLRSKGRLDGPGAHIPEYVRDRHGKDVYARTQKITAWNSEISVLEAVDQAREELAEEEREAREKENQEALRAALVAQARETHESRLAADLEVAQYGVDALADQLAATEEETRSKAADLRSWLQSQKK